MWKNIRRHKCILRLTEVCALYRCRTFVIAESPNKKHLFTLIDGDNMQMYDITLGLSVLYQLLQVQKDNLKTC